MNAIIVGVFWTVLMACWGWLSLKVIKLITNQMAFQATVVERFAAVAARFDAKDRECAERLEWLRGVDRKLDTACEATARILGLLEGSKVTPPKADDASE